MILKSGNFTGPINIIGIHDESATSVGKVEDLNSFIAIYEPLYLHKILGNVLYPLFKTYLDDDANEERWNKLKGLLSKDCSALARYVFFFYIRTKTYQGAPTGTFSEGVSPRVLCTQAWVENIPHNKEVYDLLSNGDYEGFVFDDELLRPIW